MISMKYGMRWEMTILLISSYEEWLTVRHPLKIAFPGSDIEYLDTDTASTAKEIKGIWENLSKEAYEYIYVINPLWFKTITKTVKIKHLYGTPVRDYLGECSLILLPPVYQYLTDPVGWKQWLCPIEKEPVRVEETLAYDLNWLDSDLSLDLETTGLHPKRDKIVAFSIGVSKEEAIALPFKGNRELLEKIIKEGTGKLIIHNAAFDLSFLVQEFFPNDWITPYQVLFPRVEDTKLIAWLSLNSVVRPDLSLKALAQPYLGDWSQGVEHTGIITDKYLQYAKKDAQAVWYVYEQYSVDGQEYLYEEILKPALFDVVQMQLTGLPLDMDRVHQAEVDLIVIQDALHDKIKQHPIIQSRTRALREEWVISTNKKLKKKRVTYGDAQVEFNPKSSVQLRELLYGVLRLPVPEVTKKGLPSTSQDSLKTLKESTDREDIKELLTHILSWAENEKMLNTYFPVFKEAWSEAGHHFLMGHFNLGGTVSGRLSSSEPNLQNLPATGTAHAPLIRSLFKPPEGWWLVGMDFDSLEDRISALLTKDPNKLKVYTDGYDGHSLRAYQYYRNQMPDIEDTVESINSIKDRYPAFRQASKGPTFALTYGGSWKALVRVCGLSEEDSLRIESAYHDLYKVSDQWVQDQVDKGWTEGCVRGAFGLKVRTPLMASILRAERGSEELQKERRTAGNALGQSWCLLNSRACTEVLRKAREQGFQHDVLPCAQIHDASYFLIRKNPELLWWWVQVMEHAARWQEAHEIQHPEVHLSGSCVLYEPDWGSDIPLTGLNSIESLKRRIEYVL